MYIVYTAKNSFLNLYFEFMFLEICPKILKLTLVSYTILMYCEVLFRSISFFEIICKLLIIKITTVVNKELMLEKDCTGEFRIIFLTFTMLLNFLKSIFNEILRIAFLQNSYVLEYEKLINQHISFYT